MNPLLYKAHPLLYLTVDLLVNPAAHTLDDFSTVILIYLIVNLIWAGCLRVAVKKTLGFVVAYRAAYLLAFPSLVFFEPVTLTLLNDVLGHAFHFKERYILIFVLFVAVQMLAVVYGALIQWPRHHKPIGLRAGLIVALTLLLFSLPLGLILLGLNGLLAVIR